MWVQLASGRIQHRLEPVMAAAAVALVPVLVIQTDVKSSGWQEAARIANWAIWAVFLVELALVLVVAPRKLAALRAHWLDLGIVLVTAPALGTFLSSLRVARLARLLRLAMLGGRALEAERKSASEAVFRFVALLTLFIVVVAGAVESLVDRHDFPTLWDGIWWSIVTVTTVGYGDIYPRSVGGRVIAIVLMLFGIGFISVLTATVASRFVKVDTESDRILETLARIEAELAEVKRSLA